MAEPPGIGAAEASPEDSSAADMPEGPIVSPDDLADQDFRSRRVLSDLMALLASAFVHIAMIMLSLFVYLKVTQESRGPGFVAGSGGLGQPLEVQRIEGFDENLNLENALAVDTVSETAPSERPVMEPEVTLRQPEVRPDLVGAVKSVEAKVTLESLVARQWSKAALSSRSPGMKSALLKSEGGTPESEKAVARGLEWLAEHQNEDGSWSLSPASRCGHAECGSTTSESPETATALALLPFLGAGHFPGEEGPYAKTVDRALSWLQSRVDKSGRVIPNSAPTHFHMYAHAIVTIALCEATALKPDGEWAPAAKRAAQYIINAQNRDDGGWRYFPGQAGDTSVYGWQMMALRSARISGMTVPKTTMTLARRWLTASRAATDGSLFAYQPGRPASPVMTAEALLCRQLLGDGQKARGMGRGTAAVTESLKASLGNRNYYFWYYATQLMHNTGGKPWSRWNLIIREKLIAEQFVGPEAGHAAGSWQPTEPAMDRWGRTGGPIMQTALGLLTLEVYYRYLPMYQVTPDPEKSEEVPLAKPADD